MSKPKLALLGLGLVLLAAAGVKLGGSLSGRTPEPIASHAVVSKPSPAEVAGLPAPAAPLPSASTAPLPSAAALHKPKHLPLALSAAAAQQDPTSEFGGRR